MVREVDGKYNFSISAQVTSSIGTIPPDKRRSILYNHDKYYKRLMVTWMDVYGGIFEMGRGFAPRVLKSGGVD
jgi:hypothetical protein